LKGDAGEGRTYVDLLGHYDRERILHQPRFKDVDSIRVPDFVVTSAQNPDKFIEIVDAKAWSLTRQRDAQGKPLNYEDFFSYLLERPDPRSVLNMHEMQRVVEKYASSPRLEIKGKVVLYLPEDIIRYTPQVPRQIQNWSGTDIAHGKVVEVRSMGVWNDELWDDVRTRLER